MVARRERGVHELGNYELHIGAKHGALASDVGIVA